MEALVGIGATIINTSFLVLNKLNDEKDVDAEVRCVGDRVESGEGEEQPVEFQPYSDGPSLVQAQLCHSGPSHISPRQDPFFRIGVHWSGSIDQSEMHPYPPELIPDEWTSERKEAPPISAPMHKPRKAILKRRTNKSGSGSINASEMNSSPPEGIFEGLPPEEHATPSSSPTCKEVLKDCTNKPSNQVTNTEWPASKWYEFR
eukprot:gnl/MRDRNA2_/MRDRNA2_99086_c0_seq1.p1 gnl/MRDRNA2_/MRDRNA2_99086_c0~~gnl/MRDRNA2_/MRDRNA2_99086_c0_seq1.p1  ORF type:complete len:203 (+),score=31.39 gnl/MRDRNA2_/MRDRNA2_99086_c0_seq1:62-670(+)